MACQAIDLLSPHTSTAPLQAIHDLVRQTIPYVFQSLNNRKQNILYLQNLG